MHPFFGPHAFSTIRCRDSILPGAAMHPQISRISSLIQAPPSNWHPDIFFHKWMAVYWAKRGLMGIQPFTDSSARMNQGKLFVLIARDLDQRCLQRIKNHTEHGSRSCALRVVSVRFFGHKHGNDNVRTLGQRRIKILRDRNNRYTLLLADFQYRQQFLCLAAAGRQHHNVAFFQKPCSPMHRFSG